MPPTSPSAMTAIPGARWCRRTNGPRGAHSAIAQKQIKGEISGSTGRGYIRASIQTLGQGTQTQPEHRQQPPVQVQHQPQHATGRRPKDAKARRVGRCLTSHLSWLRPGALHFAIIAQRMAGNFMPELGAIIRAFVCSPKCPRQRGHSARLPASPSINASDPAIRPAPWGRVPPALRWPARSAKDRHQADAPD